MRKRSTTTGSGRGVPSAGRLPSPMRLSRGRGQAPAEYRRSLSPATSPHGPRGPDGDRLADVLGRVPVPSPAILATMLAGSPPLPMRRGRHASEPESRGRGQAPAEYRRSQSPSGSLSPPGRPTSAEGLRVGVLVRGAPRPRGGCGASPLETQPPGNRARSGRCSLPDLTIDPCSPLPPWQGKRPAAGMRALATAVDLPERRGHAADSATRGGPRRGSVSKWAWLGSGRSPRPPDLGRAGWLWDDRPPRPENLRQSAAKFESPALLRSEPRLQGSRACVEVCSTTRISRSAGVPCRSALTR